MKRALPILIMIFLLISFAAPVLGAEAADPGVGEPTPIPAGRPAGAAYTPVEQRADDSGMALIVAMVFGLPVASWLVIRMVKKSRNR